MTNGFSPFKAYSVRPRLYAPPWALNVIAVFLYNEHYLSLSFECVPLLARSSKFIHFNDFVDLLNI